MLEPIRFHCIYRRPEHSKTTQSMEWFACSSSEKQGSDHQNQWWAVRAGKAYSVSHKILWLFMFLFVNMVFCLFLFFAVTVSSVHFGSVFIHHVWASSAFKLSRVVLLSTVKEWTQWLAIANQMVWYFVSVHRWFVKSNDFKSSELANVAVV